MRINKKMIRNLDEITQEEKDFILRFKKESPETRRRAFQNLAVHFFKTFGKKISRQVVVRLFRARGVSNNVLPPPRCVKRNRKRK